jgi:hypothetical protein
VKDLGILDAQIDLNQEKNIISPFWRISKSPLR